MTWIIHRQVSLQNLFALFRNSYSFILHSSNNAVSDYTFVAYNLRINSGTDMSAAVNHDKFC